MDHQDLVAAVKEALADHPCRYTVHPRDIDHLIGVVIDLGDGDLRCGIERLRKNHQWLVDRRGKDEEYAANHEAMSGLRLVTRTFGLKLAHVCMWVLVFIMAAGLVLFGASKVAPSLKIGG